LRDPHTFAEVWRSNTKLELSGDLVKEWENFTQALSGAGITLQDDSRDILIWTSGDASGRMTVKNFYNSILTTHGLPNLDRLEGQSLEMETATKNSSLFRLASENKILFVGRPAEKRMEWTGHMHFMQRI
jgi:hypothetical protein